MRDLRFALRQLAHAPGYALTAIVTLALGMGATTAFFSVLYGVVLREPPYPDAGRLVALENRRLDAPAHGGRLSRAEVRDYRERVRAFARVSAWDLGRQTLTAAGSSEGFAERVKVSGVTPDLFDTLGVAAARGRTFRDSDLGGAPAVVISDAFWRAYFAAAPDVLSRSVRLNGVEFPIVGVMPAGFSYPEDDMAVWVALDLRPESAADRTNRFLGTVARLAPGVDAGAAAADLARVAADLRRERPDAYPDPQWTIGAVSLRERHFGHLELPLTALLAASAAVLLIACLNVAIMALLRAVARRREMAIRLAIGASRGAIARQLLTEAAVLSALGAGAGLFVAAIAVDALRAFAPAGIPRIDEVGIHLPAALCTLAILVVATLVVGLAPALMAARLRAFDSAIPSTRTSDSRSTTRLRDALTVGEVALAAALVIGAGLTLRSLYGLLHDELGFETSRRVSFKTNLTEKAYPDGARVEQFYEQLTSRIAGLPGTRSIGAISYVPLSGEGMSVGAAPAAAPDSATAEVGWGVVRGRYFETMGIRLRHGRLFADTDRAEAPLVLVVDETLARRWFPDAAAAVGQSIRVTNRARREIRTIVGVVAPVSHAGPGRPNLPQAYAPLAQVPGQRGMYTVLDTTAAPATVFAAARAALAAVDPAVPLYFAETSDRRYDDVVALPRFTAGLVGAFSTLALILAGVGIFGVTAYAVSQRTREFGIRLALGAQRTSIRTLVLGRVALLVGLGLAAGGALAVAMGGLIDGLLFGVEPDDPLAFAISGGALALTALVATLAPMRAAVRVDPAVTLKAE